MNNYIDLLGFQKDITYSRSDWNVTMQIYQKLNYPHGIIFIQTGNA